MRGFSPNKIITKARYITVPSAAIRCGIEKLEHVATVAV